MQELTKKRKNRLDPSLNVAIRNIDDALSSKFGDYVDQIYHIQLIIRMPIYI